MSLGPYWLGDIPAQPAVIYIERDSDALPLTDFDSAEVLVYNPDGTHAFVGTATIVSADEVRVTWPAAGCFNIRGVYSMQFVLKRTAPAAQETTSVLKFVVQERATGWYTLEWARDRWRDAPRNDENLFTLLEVSRIQVEAFAPTQPAGIAAPNLREAQLVQARNTWNATKQDPANQGIGDEGFIIRPWPLDLTVKAMIRPPTAKPVVR